MDVRITRYFFRTVNLTQCLEHSALDVPTDYSTCNVDTVFLEWKMLSSIDIICYDNRCDTNSLQPKPKTGMQTHRIYTNLLFKYIKMLSHHCSTQTVTQYLRVKKGYM